MKRLIAAAVAATLAGSALAVAQDGIPTDDDRYIVTEIEEGILRVDRETGQASLCVGEGREWQCSLVPDDRDALEADLDRLRRENRRLRRELAELDRESGRQYGYYADPRQEYDDMGEGGIMTREEVDKAMNTLEYMMERFMGAAERLREKTEPWPPQK